MMQMQSATAAPPSTRMPPASRGCCGARVSLNTLLLGGVCLAWLCFIAAVLYVSYRYEGMGVWLAWEQFSAGWCEYDRRMEVVRER